jgi:hypothetical protein
VEIDRRREILDSGDAARLSALLAEQPELATAPLADMCDHPPGDAGGLSRG